MNSKQRRQKRRSVKRMAERWASLTLQMLDELESAEITIVEAREELTELAALLQKEGES